MKMVTAIIRPGCLEAAQRSLGEFGTRGVIFGYVGGCGSQAGSPLIYRGVTVKDRQPCNIKLEVVVDDPLVDEVVQAIQTCTNTGQDADCVIYVQPLERMIRIGPREARTLLANGKLTQARPQWN
jgi:nitrogen regulatory protein P-II 2